MFLTDALRTLAPPGEYEIIPEYSAFAEELTKGLEVSSSTKLMAVIVATLLKQMTVWDRLIVRALDPISLSRILNTRERTNGFVPDRGTTLLVARQAVSSGLLETAVQHAPRDEIFKVLPAPRGLLVFVLEDADDIARALRMHLDYPDAVFSTIIVSRLRSSDVHRFKAVLEDQPHRVAAWTNCGGPEDLFDLVSVIAIGDGAYEI